MKNIAQVVQRALVPTGKTVGGPKKKRGGMLAKVAEKAVSKSSAPGGRPTVPNSDDEGKGMRGLLARSARRAMRRY